jgi:hypothetical protein
MKRALFLLQALLVLNGGVVLAQAPDPSTTGPHAVTTEEYTQGNTAFRPTNFPGNGVEITAAVFSPTDIQNGPYPLVIYLHGRHATCGTATLAWPCPAGQAPIRSYRGYDYSAQQLASHGFIVVSISANGINAQDNNTNDLGALARAQLIQRHLDIWRGFNTTGGSPFGTKFVGEVDLLRVGTMGHSRGGEGVLRHFLFNRTQPSPYPVKLIAPIAPTNFSRWQVNDGVAVAQILSYCDGDVNNIQGLHAFDDARYQMPSAGYQHYVAVMGGNHNFYNTQWTPGTGPGAIDDWTSTSDRFCGTVAGNGRLTAAQQRAVGLAYLAAFFRTEVGGASQFFQYIDGSGGLPPSVSSLNLNVSYHGNDEQRRDLNRLLAAADLVTDFLGGASNQTGLSPHDLCGGESPQAQNCLANQAATRQPHTAASSRSTRRGLSQLRTGWSASGASFSNDIPAGPDRDVSGFRFFQFRASVNFADTRNPSGQAQDLSVTFTDDTGASQSLRAGQFSRALFFPPGTNGAVPKVWLNSVRIPMASLTAVDTTHISRVSLSFNQRASGALLLSDLHFYGQAAPPAPSFTLSANPTGLSAAPGGSATSTLTVTSRNGFAGAVSLACANLPAGVSCSFNPAAVTPPAGGAATSTLTVSVASTTPAGTSTFQVRGTSGSLVQSVGFTLQVNTPGGELITNGGFEGASAAPWTLTGNALRSTGGFPHGGTGYLLLGRANSATGAAFQQLTLPSGRAPRLSFWLNVSSEETEATAFDQLFVEVLNSSGALLQTLAVFSNLDQAAAGSYTLRSGFDLSGFAGQTVRVQFRAATDGSLVTNFRVDDVSLQ